MPHYIKRGYYKTKWNAQRVPRYQCKQCGRHFSSHTFKKTFGQKKPYLNEEVFRWYSSGTTQRRMAKVMGINRKTVIRKFLFMANLSRVEHERAIRSGRLKTSLVNFDEMETFEHTRLKPLAIVLAVRAKTGEIIEAKVAKMNCHGKLAPIARIKYGLRQDSRPKIRQSVLRCVNKCSRNHLKIVTDQHPSYPSVIANCVPLATHKRVERIRKQVSNESFQRRNPQDALFALNHTAAKIRHDLSRMARKVWVTTKKAERLQAHLDLYIAYNNRYKLQA